MSPARKRPSFEHLHNVIAGKIDRQKLHYSQQLPGMTPDEIRAEMLECLWRAWDTYKASTGVPIEKYFWRIWIHRKSDLLTFYQRQRRDYNKETLVAAPVGVPKLHPDTPIWLEDSGPSLRPVRTVLPEPDDQVVPPAPTDDPVAKKMWVLLAQGNTRQDVLSALDITKRTYYEIRDAWRAMGPEALFGEVG